MTTSVEKFHSDSEGSRSQTGLESERCDQTEVKHKGLSDEQTGKRDGSRLLTAKVKDEARHLKLVALISLL